MSTTLATYLPSNRSDRLGVFLLFLFFFPFSLAPFLSILQGYNIANIIFFYLSLFSHICKHTVSCGLHIDVLATSSWFCVLTRACSNLTLHCCLICACWEFVFCLSTCAGFSWACSHFPCRNYYFTTTTSPPDCMISMWTPNQIN